MRHAYFDILCRSKAYFVTEILELFLHACRKLRKGDYTATDLARFREGPERLHVCLRSIGSFGMFYVVTEV